MIYRNSYFSKELRQAYTGSRTSTQRHLAAALFLGLFSFALFFLLQTLHETILAETVPQIMQPSFFSTLYIYIHVVFVFLTLYFMVYYEPLFLAEIRKNSWYLLIQMGYRPVRMFLSKLTALFYSVLVIYTVGFLATILLTVFLKYTFIVAYMPALYVAGLTDLLLLTLLALTFSLYTRTLINARYWTFFGALFIVAGKNMLGQYTVISDRILMRHIVNVFDPHLSAYMAAAAGIMLICALICLIRSKNLAQYYTPEISADLVPDTAEIVRFHARTGKRRPVFGRRRHEWYGRALNAAMTAFLILFICAALVFNLFIIVLNAAVPGQEMTIGGVIPYVFQSRTMEPAIRINDLAYFKKVDAQEPIKPNEIILFTENNIVYVERVQAKHGDNLVVDIDNYPPLSQAGAMIKTVPRQDVQGLYIGRNRWLGALIVFANTIFGRLLFLLVPAVLLFYHAQIYKYFRKER